MVDELDELYGPDFAYRITNSQYWIFTAATCNDYFVAIQI